MESKRAIFRGGGTGLIPAVAAQLEFLRFGELFFFGTHWGILWRVICVYLGAESGRVPRWCRVGCSGGEWGAAWRGRVPGRSLPEGKRKAEFLKLLALASSWWV